MTNTNIYKVTLYRTYGLYIDTKDTIILFVSCNHKPNFDELKANKIIEEEVFNHDCSVISEAELITKFELKKYDDIKIISLD